MMDVPCVLSFLGNDAQRHADEYTLNNMRHGGFQRRSFLVLMQTTCHEVFRGHLLSESNNTHMLNTAGLTLFNFHVRCVYTDVAQR